MLVWIVIAVLILLCLLLTLNVVSNKVYQKHMDAFDKHKLSEDSYNSFTYFKDEALHGNIDKIMKILIGLKSGKNVALLSFRYPSLVNYVDKYIDTLEELFERHLFTLNKLKKKDRDSFAKALNPVIKNYDSDTLVFAEKVLSSSESSRLLLKKCFQDSKEINTWDEFRKGWQYSEVFTDYEISDMNEKYQYMAIFLYQRTDDGAFKTKLHELLAKLNEIKSEEFRKLITSVDKYLSMEGRLVANLKDIGYKTPPPMTENAVKQEVAAVAEQSTGVGDSSIYEDSSGSFSEDEPSRELDLDLPVELLAEAEVETADKAISGTDFTFPFEKLESWQAYVERFDQTPLDAIDGLLGDSGMILRKKYQLAIMNLLNDPEVHEDAMDEIEEAWLVIEDIKSHGYIN